MKIEYYEEKRKNQNSYDGILTNKKTFTTFAMYIGNILFVTAFLESSGIFNEIEKSLHFYLH